MSKMNDMFWWKNSKIRGVKYDVKVMGQIFLTDDNDLEWEGGSCLPTSFEMAAWHLMYKRFKKGRGIFSSLGDFTISPSHRLSHAPKHSRIGIFSSASDANLSKNFEFTKNKYYWNQPMLHLTFKCKVSKMLDFINKSAINMGIWDCCKGSIPSPKDVIDSLNKSQRVPIFTFSFKRPEIEIDPDTKTVISVNFSEEACLRPNFNPVDSPGHAVVITGWRKNSNSNGKSENLEFLVNDPGPGIDALLDLTRDVGETIECGSQYWISSSCLFDSRWHPNGLYEVYSNSEMLDANDGGVKQNLYLPEYYVSNMKILKNGHWEDMY